MSALYPLLLLVLVVVAASVSIAAAPPDQPDPPAPQACPGKCVPISLLVRSEARSRKRLALARRFERQRNGLRRAVKASSQRSVWYGLLCIHGHEGAWNSATGNGYFGGLQMDRSFMAHYGGPLLGSLGTANRWPPEAQIAVGIVAFYAGRGYGPWPNTRKDCGL